MLHTTTGKILNSSHFWFSGEFRVVTGIILKLDFEKAYDKVNWNFLFEYMQMRGFSEKWRIWITQVVTGGTVSIKVND